MKLFEGEKTRKFNFGKIAMWPRNRKANLVEVDIFLRPLENGQMEFSAMGTIWNCRKTDCLTCGQNLDEIREYLKFNPLFEEIYDLWEKYHLNGLKSGTRRQHEALEKETERRNELHRKAKEPDEKSLVSADRYEEACEYLKSIGLYVDSLGEDEALSCAGEGVTADHYPYAAGWITYILDELTLKRINSLIDKGEIYVGIF